MTSSPLANAGLLIALAAGMARAEFLSIEQRFGGIDCPSCGKGVERALKRMGGVESVELGDGVMRLKLAAGNGVRLERIHDALKGAGYTPGEARVTVIGKSDGGEFEVAGFAPPYRIRYEGKPFEGPLRGVVAAPKAGSPLALRAVD